MSSPVAAQALGALTLVRIDAAVFEFAAELDPAVLRNLDATHLAAVRRLEMASQALPPTTGG